MPQKNTNNATKSHNRNKPEMLKNYNDVQSLYILVVGVKV